MVLQRRDASVSIMTGRPGFDFRQKKEFSLPHFIDTGSGLTSLSDSVYTERYLTWVEQPRHKSDHSPRTSADIKVCYSFLYGVVLN
jgi:hypothetical protein